MADTMWDNYKRLMPDVVVVAMDKSGMTYLYNGPIFYNHMSNGWVSVGADVARLPLGLIQTATADFNYKTAYQIRPDLDEATRKLVQDAIDSTPNRMTSFSQPKQGVVQELPSAIVWSQQPVAVGLSQPDAVFGVGAQQMTPFAPVAPQPMARPVIPLEVPNPHSLLPAAPNASTKELAGIQLRAIVEDIGSLTRRVEELKRLIES